MAGDEPPTTSSTAAVSSPVADSILSPPPQDPVGSPSRDVPEIQSLISKDDHDQGSRENRDQGHEPAAKAAVLPEDLKQRIVKQVTLPPLPSPLSIVHPIEPQISLPLGFAWFAIFGFVNQYVNPFFSSCICNLIATCDFLYIYLHR